MVSYSEVITRSHSISRYPKGKKNLGSRGTCRNQPMGGTRERSGSPLFLYKTDATGRPHTLHTQERAADLGCLLRLLAHGGSSAAARGSAAPPPGRRRQPRMAGGTYSGPPFLRPVGNRASLWICVLVRIGFMCVQVLLVH
jgi:hypothetical protein